MDYQDFKQMEQLVINQQKILAWMEQLIEYDKERGGELFKAGAVKAYISMNKNTCEILTETLNKYMPEMNEKNSKSKTKTIQRKSEAENKTQEIDIQQNLFA